MNKIKRTERGWAGLFDGKTDLEAESIHEKTVDYVIEHFDEVYKG